MLEQIGSLLLLIGVMRAIFCTVFNSCLEHWQGRVSRAGGGMQAPCCRATPRGSARALLVMAVPGQREVSPQTIVELENV